MLDTCGRDLGSLYRAKKLAKETVGTMSRTSHRYINSCVNYGSGSYADALYCTLCHELRYQLAVQVRQSQLSRSTVQLKRQFESMVQTGDCSARVKYTVQGVETRK